jgi:L-lactate dehydrogenase complex protein LldG
MEAVRTEVHVVPSSGWTDALRNILIPRKLQTLLFAPGTEYGQALARSWEQYPDTLPTLKPYSGNIESFKEDLFMADAAITGCRGAIAQTGALILVPSEEEPRLMSLVPHIHIALLAADTVYATLAEAIAGQAWSSGMPTNTLLISGPSKTADIEFTLAFGVHGPKELILLILDDR